ncbi:hypothetical protein UPYG_G00031480 [Umbra pygmaea]|uniref:MARVEL domain-containing protein n=1 Tax=Umbra pygmaea TaxID=75934 RepID=A0ABD0XMV3_UMBPY
MCCYVGRGEQGNVRHQAFFGLDHPRESLDAKQRVLSWRWHNEQTKQPIDDGGLLGQFKAVIVNYKFTFYINGVILTASMSQSSQPQRGERGRKGRGPSENREYRPQREGRHNDRPPPSNSSSSQPPYYKDSARGQPAQNVQRQDQEGSKCSHICSRRGLVLICSVLTNALVLICVVAAQMTISGMTAMGGLAGGFDLNTNIPFEGPELQQVRDLDMQYSQMRSPGVYGGVVFALIFGVGSLLFVVSGNKPSHLLGKRLLIGALVFQGLGAVMYVVAVGLYLHFIIQVNSTDVCIRRERMYARVGFTWMNCEVGGADAAVALFGLITAILYGVGAGLMFFTERWVRGYLKARKNHQEMERKTNTADRTADRTADGTADRTVDNIAMNDSSRLPLYV